MEEKQSTFKLAMKPGLITGIIAIAISLILWTVISDIETRQYVGYITWFVIAFLFYKYTVDYRETSNNGGLTYGESFVFMLFMTIIYAFLMSIYSYIFFAYIDPDIVEQMKEIAAEQMYQQNMPEESAETAIEIQSAFMNPIFMSISAFFGTGIIGIIIALIMSIFTKKEVVETIE